MNRTTVFTRAASIALLATMAMSAWPVLGQVPDPPICQLSSVTDSFLSENSRHVFVKFHVVCNNDTTDCWPTTIDNGDPEVGVNRLMAWINRDSGFGGARIQFIKVGDIEYLYNTNWNFADGFDRDSMLMYEDPNAINVYLAHSADGSYPGITPTTPSRHTFVAKASTKGYLPHELGHCLGLAHYTTDNCNWMYPYPN